MEYLQEDPYSSHNRLHQGEPYITDHYPQDHYSSGPYNDQYNDPQYGVDNYGHNASFDRQSQQSLQHRGTSRPDIPNGAPYGHNGQDVNTSHLRSASPHSFTGGPGGPYDDGVPLPYDGGPSGRGSSPGYRESPYHNLPPYHPAENSQQNIEPRHHDNYPSDAYDDQNYHPGSQNQSQNNDYDPRYDPNYSDQNFDRNQSGVGVGENLPGHNDYEDDYVEHRPAPQYLDENGRVVGGPSYPGQGPPIPPGEGPLYDGGVVHGQGLRGSYAGSQSSFQGGPPSGAYTDPYPQDAPRYNGGAHYPDDGRDPAGEPQYSDQGDPQYAGDQPSFQEDPYSNRSFANDPNNSHPNFQHDEPPLPQGSFLEDPTPQQHSFHSDPQQQHSFHEDPNSINPHQSFHSVHNGDLPSFHDDQHPSFQHDQQHPSFHDDHGYPHGDPQMGYAPGQGQPDPRDLPQVHPDDLYSDHQTFPKQSQQNLAQDFHDGPHDPYQPQHLDQGYDPNYPEERRQEGLPPVRSDPFADDPFREPTLQEDPYYRGDPYAQDPQYNDRAPAYDDRGGSQMGDPRPPQFDDRGPPLNERDGLDPYTNAPRYSSQPDFDQDTSRRMDQLTLGAPASGLPVRYPDLQEVIDFLTSPDDGVKASAAAHLQHVTYMDDGVKAKTRSLGGVEPLVRLLGHDKVEVHKNACGALQNLSFGKGNIDNKRAIKNEGGIPELIRLLRKSEQEDVKESVTGVMWNLSSCEDLKQCIVDDGLGIMVSAVILRYSGYGGALNTGFGSANNGMPWTSVCRNTTGVLRNVSSAGFDARKRLRESRGLVNALIHMLKVAADDNDHNDIDNKVVENTVCVLRNLSYRIQEVVDPDFYKKRTLPRQQGGGKGKGSEGPGCFGNKSAKAKKAQAKSPPNSTPPALPAASIEYRSLWGPEIHSLYSKVLKRCTNPVTMEAAAGAIQNLTACDWQPAVESRAMVRKEKGLPLLVDLLSAESDRVVCATATALRNLALDDKNKELVGKYAIRQLVSRLPRDNRNMMPDDTICAVVATLYEVVKDNQDFALALVQEDGLPRLVHINTSQQRYLARTLKFCQTLLKTLWGFKSLHSEYAKLQFGQPDFNTLRATPRQDGQRPPETAPPSSTHTTPYNTLSRPQANQGYDDSTMSPARFQGQRNHHDQRDGREEVGLSDLGGGYAPLDEPRPHTHRPPPGGVPLFPSLAPPNDPYNDAGGEPVYAQVNKGSRRRQEQSQGQMMGSQGHMEPAGGADSWV